MDEKTNSFYDLANCIQFNIDIGLKLENVKLIKASTMKDVVFNEAIFMRNKRHIDKDIDLLLGILESQGSSFELQKIYL